VLCCLEPPEIGFIQQRVTIDRRGSFSQQHALLKAVKFSHLREAGGLRFI